MSNRQSNYPVVVDSAAAATNPSALDVIADTGALPAGIYEVLVIVSSTATAPTSITVQRRNAGNTATVGDTIHFNMGANAPVAIPLRFEVELNERIRVLVTDAETGILDGNIIAQRVA